MKINFKKILVSPWTALLTLALVVSVRVADPTFVESVRLRYFDTLITSTAPTENNIVTVNIDGVLQLKSAFNLNTNVLTFTGTPSAGSVIEVKSVSNSGLTVLTGLAYDTFTGDGSTINFTLSTYPAGKNFTMVTVGGIVQNKSNYLISTNVITFSTPPPNTAPIEVTTFGPAAVTGTNAATTGKAIAMSIVFGG